MKANEKKHLREQALGKYIYRKYTKKTKENKMNLYELSIKYQQVLDLAESGKFDEETLQDTLESLDDAIENKAEGYAMVDKELEYTEKKLADEIKRLQERKANVTHNRKKLKDSLADEMLKMDKKKIKTNKFTIWIQKNPESLKIEDETHIPKRFFIEQDPKLDKKALLKELKETEEELKGVEITQTEGLRIK